MAKTAKPESKPALKSAARMSKRGPLDQALLRKMAAQDARRKGLVPEQQNETPPTGQGKKNSRAQTETDDTQP